MSKLFFFTIMMAIASIASVGFLGVNFDMITQALGTFSFLDENIELLGCDCMDSAGNTVPCDDAQSTIIGTPLCPTEPSDNP